MIEATCAACGTVNRIAEAELPPGAKTVTCSSCKARVPLAAKPAGIPAIPKSIPAIPPKPLADLPAPKSEPTKRAETGPLGDLPAPRRASPLAGLEPSKPAPKSPFADADLPAPKPKPMSPLSPLELDDAWGGAAAALGKAVEDLPAPKPAARPPVAAAPKPPAAAKPAVSDLPTPKRDGGVDLPAPKRDGGVDLPAPKRAGAPDLTVPRAASMTPPKGNAVLDLPTPRVGEPNLPAPKRDAAPNLPAPKRESAPAAATPKRGAAPIDAPPRDATPNLPVPKRESTPVAAPKPPAPALELDPLEPEVPSLDDALELADEPGVKLDLPAPKGFFDDLPQPAKPGKPDLLAPKGFFDDLPQPAKPGKADLPAPKGFFDDLPQVAKPSVAGPPAPKGFFDDLPQPAKPSVAGPPAPKGFFDDLPQPAKSASAAVAAKGFFDDPPPPKADAKPDHTGAALPNPSPGDLDLGPPSTLDLELAPPTNPPGPPLDFGELDLSQPTEPPQPKSGITIKTPAGTSARPAAQSSSSLAPQKGDLSLDLESEPARDRAKPVAAPEVATKRAAAADAAAAAKAKKRKRSRLAIGALVLAVAGGGGGFYYYQRRQAAEQRAAEIEQHLASARKIIHQAAPDHWQRAATEAGAVLERDPHNIDAIGLRAEALIAGALDTGTNSEQRLAQGKKVLADALEANITGAPLDTPRALELVAAHQADRAVPKLQAMVARAPNNGFGQLYLAWALAGQGDYAGAVKACDAAIAADPAVKVSALYARGNAKLQLLDLAGAKADFAAVLDQQKDHIGAQVGLAATLPAAQAEQRESDLLAILARKDIGSADPRAIMRAWRLAADIARDDSRLDVARDRYQKALAIDKTNVPALLGAALTELADKKLEVAGGLVARASAQEPDNPRVQTVVGELDVLAGKLDEASAIAQKLADRKPPLAPRQRADVQELLASILAAKGQPDDAIDAEIAGAKLVGDVDLKPMMSAVAKLGELAKQAADNHDDAKAQGYRDKADQLISSLADRAKDDAGLSRTLGTAYLNANDPVKAESFLQRAVDMQGDDVEAHLALAQALQRQNRSDDALAQLGAAQKLDPTRADVALEIARTYDDAGRADDAKAAYAALLAAKDVAVAARVRAGKFLARAGDFASAAAQAAPILAAEPDNPAGHYFKALDLAAAQKLDDARKEITLAVDGDPDPQYLDEQGRIGEASVVATSDPKYYDLAQRAYERAITAAPALENAQAGLGRIYIGRKEWSKAIEPLLTATKLAPKDADVMFNIGVTYKNLGQPQVAAQWFAAQLKLKSTAIAYWELGQLDQDANRGPETVHAYTEATRLGSDEEKAGAKLEWLTEAYYRLGQVEQLAHDDHAARAAFQHYVDRNPPAGAELEEAKRLLSGELRR